ncbi:hypothetical protein JOE49_000070 [Paenibacillus sp. PvR133]|uniref:hypothetical protein n=1 Tax=Paenibacillus sp. PvR133 TaxID=2806598 RepID=UPI001AE59DA2|nr:hypothetical protein [Paenibacillus sp. PvR133]MBP1172818.1 hypothetical protein [Paenibacillus sp. PvR133]
MTEEEKEYYRSKIDFNKWILGIISILLGFTITLFGKLNEMRFLYILLLGWGSLSFCFFSSYALLRMYFILFETKIFPERPIPEKLKPYLKRQNRDSFYLTQRQLYSFFIGHLCIFIFVLLNLIF